MDEKARSNAKVALITGAGRNLGREMAITLLAAGHRVILTSFSEDRLKEVARESGAPAEQFLIVPADLEKPEDRLRLINTSLNEFGRIDILVNNAAVTSETYWPNWLVEGEPKPWLVSEELYRAFLEIDAIAPHVLTAAALPGMLERGWGRIINITTSLKTMLTFWPYGSAKAALEAETAILGRELEGTGVTANVLVPGGFAKAGPLHLSSGHVITPQLSPSVMSAPVRWLASDESHGINAQRIVGANWDASLPNHIASKNACFPAGWDAGLAPPRLPSIA